jgi:hypothetical protein
MIPKIDMKALPRPPNLTVTQRSMSQAMEHVKIDRKRDGFYIQNKERKAEFSAIYPP